MSEHREQVKRDHYETCMFNNGACGLPRNVLVTTTRGDTLQGLNTPKVTTRMECAKGHYSFP